MFFYGGPAMKLKVASVQMITLNEDYEGNKARAYNHIIEAVEKGAKLILLPEFALAGYCFEDRLWEYAEPLKGRTFMWLQALARKYDIYIGTCILETDGKDFFDTFVLSGPDEFFFHRKIEPASYEAFSFTARGMNMSVFDTRIGRIGVAICFDTTKTQTMRMLIEQKPELLLLAYSSPELPWFCLPRDRRVWVDEYNRTPGLYASFLGCPVVVSNKTGEVHTRIPMLPPFMRMDVKFTDGTCIIDRKGNNITGTLKGPGIAVGEIDTGIVPTSAKTLPGGRWFIPFTPSVRITMDSALLMGRLRYHLSSRRKEAAARTFRRSD
jgi:predicted amidohydrolase